jgi:mRNA-degrading endonuclease RelE of RelBE toxin-antitoxin system
VSQGDPYTIRVSSAAARALRETLPEAVVAAVVELLSGPLASDPYRVGKPLQAPLQGRMVARRGTYRVVYRIEDKTRTVTVEHVSHRRDAYRPR